MSQAELSTKECLSSETRRTKQASVGKPFSLEAGQLMRQAEPMRRPAALKPALSEGRGNVRGGLRVTLAHHLESYRVLGEWRERVLHLSVTDSDTDEPLAGP